MARVFPPSIKTVTTDTKVRTINNKALMEYIPNSIWFLIVHSRSFILPQQMVLLAFANFPPSDGDLATAAMLSVNFLNCCSVKIYWQNSYQEDFLLLALLRKLVKQSLVLCSFLYLSWHGEPSWCADNFRVMIPANITKHEQLQCSIKFISSNRFHFGNLADWQI